MLGETIPISLEVSVGSEPIQGSISVCDESPRPFRGWLQLSALLLGAARRDEDMQDEEHAAGSTEDGRRTKDW